MVPDHWSNDAMVSMDRCGLGVGDVVQTNLSDRVEGDFLLLFNVGRVLVRHICPFCILTFLEIGK